VRSTAFNVPRSVAESVDFISATGSVPPELCARLRASAGVRATSDCTPRVAVRANVCHAYQRAAAHRLWPCKKRRRPFALSQRRCVPTAARQGCVCARRHAFARAGELTAYSRVAALRSATVAPELPADHGAQCPRAGTLSALLVNVSGPGKRPLVEFYAVTERECWRATEDAWQQIFVPGLNAACTACEEASATGVLRLLCTVCVGLSVRRWQADQAVPGAQPEPRYDTVRPGSRRSSQSGLFRRQYEP
jgi:hypothetical protein